MAAIATSALLDGRGGENLLHWLRAAHIGLGLSCSCSCEVSWRHSR
jgi:hypothetical protein